jgi:hypothetical protein
MNGMSLVQWALAILWLVANLIVVAAVLALVAVTDPARRHRPGTGDGGSRP